MCRCLPEIRVQRVVHLAARQMRAGARPASYGARLLWAAHCMLRAERRSRSHGWPSPPSLETLTPSIKRMRYGKLSGFAGSFPAQCRTSGASQLENGQQAAAHLMSKASVPPQQVACNAGKALHAFSLQRHGFELSSASRQPIGSPAIVSLCQAASCLLCLLHDVLTEDASSHMECASCRSGQPLPNTMSAASSTRRLPCTPSHPRPSPHLPPCRPLPPDPPLSPRPAPTASPPSPHSVDQMTHRRQLKLVLRKCPYPIRPCRQLARQLPFWRRRRWGVRPPRHGPPPWRGER